MSCSARHVTHKKASEFDLDQMSGGSNVWFPSFNLIMERQATSSCHRKSARRVGAPTLGRNKPRRSDARCERGITLVPTRDRDYDSCCERRLKSQRSEAFGSGRHLVGTDPAKSFRANQPGHFPRQPSPSKEPPRSRCKQPCTMTWLRRRCGNLTADRDALTRRQHGALFHFCG